MDSAVIGRVVSFGYDPRLWVNTRNTGLTGRILYGRMRMILFAIRLPFCGGVPDVGRSIPKVWQLVNALVTTQGDAVDEPSRLPSVT